MASLTDYKGWAKMKRMVSLVAVLVLGSAAPSLALLGPETSVGLRVGTGTFLSDVVFNRTTVIKSPIVLGVTAGMRQGHFGWELSVNQITFDLNTDIKKAVVTMIPILLTMQYHLHLAEEDGPFGAYFGAGGGYYINSARASSEAKALSGVSDYKAELDNSVGFHLAAGTNFKISSAVAFVIDTRFAFTSTDLTLKGGGFSDSDIISTNGIIITAGMKYFFPK
jgi:hypothetical protein